MIQLQLPRGNKRTFSAGIQLPPPLTPFRVGDKEYSTS